MTSPWTARPANMGAPGHANRGDEYEALLDQVEFLSTGFPGKLAYKTQDTSITNDAVYDDDAHLAVTVLASAVYAVEVYGMYQAGATGQIKFQFTYPSGTFEAGSWEYDAGTDAASQVNWAVAGGGLAAASPVAMVAGLVGTGGNVPFRLTGMLFVGTTAGTFALQWAQNVSNATATILRKGSFLRLTRAA